ncbi:class I SAM-dependent methyltransferase [Halobacteriales archaeon Cl-PHB]
MSIGDVRPFDRLARLYDLGMPSADPAVLERGLRHATRDVERLLDVGGGTGRAARALDTPSRTVIDAAPGMLREARKHGLGAVLGDAAGLPVRAAAVDAVVIVDALHHVGDQAGAVREGARVLRPGGVLVVREFDPDTLLGRMLVAAERLVGFDSSFQNPDDLAATMATAGLEPTVLDRGFGYTVVGRRLPETGEAKS